MKPNDGRTWIGPKTASSWGNILADPTNDLPDFTVWKPFIPQVTRDDAVHGWDSKNMADLDGAPYKYEITCGVSTAAANPGCTPPLPEQLGVLFNVIGNPMRYQAWLDDTGLLRKLDVTISMAYVREVDTNPLPGHPQGEYYAHVVFNLDQFGTPVTVTAPDDADITTARGVIRPK
ncbi:hypothetical protein [Actinoplanes rectilineatus]|uniref:hypothetical protein n=1 Tax=Actinoplanes rectilineatus TaxID=113571 RepID=UPI001B801694|nr:hypothetical protein [Actinoplanes rectilineatus]